MPLEAAEYDQIESTLRDLLAAAPDAVVAAWLFGSMARRTARATSDVDVAILLRAPPAKTLDGLYLDFEGSLERGLRRPVQVVVLNEAPVDLVHRVFRDGRVLLDRDRSARLRYMVQARNEYFDMLPILKEYRRPRPPHGSSR